MEDYLKSHEYDTLRSELIQLLNRSHDVWRWGLISMGSIFALTITSYFKIISGEIHGYFPYFLLCFGLFLFVGGIAIVMSNQIFQIQNAASRLGAYLAIFHEHNLQKDGWHSRNKQEKEPSQTSSIGDNNQFSLKEYNGPIIVYDLMIFAIYVLFFIMLSSIDPSNAFRFFSWGLLITILVFIELEIAKQKMNNSPIYWYKRWKNLSPN